MTYPPTIRKLEELRASAKYASMARLSREVIAKLRKAGLRPSRQRILLGRLLFGRSDCHVTAEMLHKETVEARSPVSLATVYNTLHQFAAAGLLRRLAVDVYKTYYDTNNSLHHHFFIEDTNDLIDIAANDPLISQIPAAPFGYEIESVDVIVRLRRKDLDTPLSKNGAPRRHG